MGFDDILWSSFVTHPAHSTETDELSASASARRFQATFDPISAAGRDQIRRVAENEIEKWKTNPAVYDTDGSGRVDVIRFALITAYFFDHPVIRELRNTERFDISEIQSLVTFPEDWQVRWGDCRPDAFQAEELAFAFVAAVDCRLHSPNLARLGCAVTDCPGLFASAWDTKVARTAAHCADAILYLVSGDKTLTRSDLRVLRNIPLAKGLIFVGANCRTHTWETAQKILNANLGLLTDQGLDIKPENIRPFHAALALLARQMERGISNLDSDTLTILKADLGLSTEDNIDLVANRLRKNISRFLENLDPSFDDSVTSLPPDTSYHLSKMPLLIDAIEKFVIARKGHSVLVGNARRVRAALSETEGSLRQFEEAVNSELGERSAEFKRAEEALDEFERWSGQLLSDFGKDAPVHLAKSFCAHVFDDKERFVADLSTEVTARLKKVQWRKLAKQQELLQMLTDVARHRLKEWLETRNQTWLSGISRQDNIEYIVTVYRPMKHIHGEFVKKWAEVLKREIPSLEDIELPTLESRQLGGGVTLPEGFANTIMDYADAIRCGGFLTTIGGTVGGILTWGMIRCHALPGLGREVIRRILQALFPTLKHVFHDEEEKLNTELSVQFKELEGKLFQEVLKNVEAFVSELRKRFDRDLIEHPRRVYKARKALVEKQFQQAQNS